MRLLECFFEHPRWRHAHYTFHTRIEPYFPHRVHMAMTYVYEALGAKTWLITYPDGVRFFHGSKREADEETLRVGGYVCFNKELRQQRHRGRGL